MNTKRIYIAGPMTGYEEWNFPAFDEAEKRMKEAGWEVVNPVDFDRARGFDEKTAQEFSNAELREVMAAEFVGCRRLDYYANDDRDWVSDIPDPWDETKPTWYGLADCTDLLLLNGWESSKGAFAEASVALWLGITVWEDGKIIPGTEAAPQVGVPITTIDNLITRRAELLLTGLPARRQGASEQSVLEEAQAIVAQRENQHGEFDQCLQDIADVWSLLTDNQFTASDVARMMIGLKLVNNLIRIRGKQPYNRDNPVDACGYAHGWALCEEGQA